MTLADRACDACGTFIAWRDAKVKEGRTLCRSCADRPQQETGMAEGNCKEAGCSRPVTTANSSLGLCYRHLRLKHPDKLPPSMRPKGVTPPRKSAPRSPSRAPRKPAAPPSDGVHRCDLCGQPIPHQVLKVADVLKTYGIKNRTVAIKASMIILQAARQVA